MIDPNWISAFVAVIAVTVSLTAHVSTQRLSRRADDMYKTNLEFVEAQMRLANQSWSDEYFREISFWASNVCTSLSEAIHLVGVDDEISKRRVLVNLSAYIDMGRWYFPNRDHDKSGQDKDSAYQGERQPCLDWMVWAYDVVSGNHAVADERATLIKCQRQFVSCIQEVIDPRSREKVIARVLKDFDYVATLPKIISPQ